MGVAHAPEIVATLLIGTENQDIGLLSHWAGKYTLDHWDKQTGFRQSSSDLDIFPAGS
jgi:hypothetical protein